MMSINLTLALKICEVKTQLRANFTSSRGDISSNQKILPDLNRRVGQSSLHMAEILGKL